MIYRSLVTTVLVLLAFPAAADTALQHAFQAMGNCTAITVDTARHACYDRAVPAYIHALRDAYAALQVKLAASAARAGPKPKERAEAVGPSAGGCRIARWSFHSSDSGILFIDGSTTCSHGKIFISVYDGDSGRYIGRATDQIQAATFSTALMGSANSLKIKYSIQ